MSNEESVTMWVTAMRAGNTAAAEHLWKRYFHQLMLQARSRMSSIPRSSYDEEDAAISTFHVLCKKLQQGCYPKLADREDLWQLMLTVLIRKIGRRSKYHAALKRVSGRSSSEVAIENLPAATSLEISQDCFELIAMLRDPHLEHVALLKFEGYTNDEIALRMNRTRRTIQRMLNLIRKTWEEELESEPNQRVDDSATA